MRLLVCGSRTFSDERIVNTVLDGFYDMDDEAPFVVIHGAARGADALAHAFADVPRLVEAGFLRVEPYPADWDKYGRAAGAIRNLRMLDDGKPDVVAAFVDKPLAESRGTSHMVTYALKAGVPVYVVQRMEPEAPAAVDGPQLEGQRSIDDELAA